MVTGTQGTDGPLLRGRITPSANLVGRITPKAVLTGRVHVTGDAAVYAGAYQVVPKPYEDQILYTEGKRLKENVTVKEIPFFEVSNTEGKTVYIGKEVK